MSKFLALFLIVFSQLAAAETILLMETKMYARSLSPEFKVNKKLGTAVVDVVQERLSSEGSTYNSNNVKVAGLSYNAETKEILFKRGEEVVVCGETYNRPYYIDRGLSVRNSDRCVFEVKKVKVQVVKGTESKMKSRTHVYLHIN